MPEEKLIDWEAVREAAAKKEQEEERARKEFYAGLTESRQKKDDEINGLMSKIRERIIEEQKAQMEQEQAEEEKKALEAVRAKYRKKAGALDWTMSEEEKALGAMARKLFS